MVRVGWVYNDYSVYVDTPRGDRQMYGRLVRKQSVQRHLSHPKCPKIDNCRKKPNKEKRGDHLKRKMNQEMKTTSTKWAALESNSKSVVNHAGNGG